MTDSPFQLRRSSWPAGALMTLVALAWPPAAHSAPESAEPAARYPYDPVCPWGRVADGRGVLVRCLGAAEAQSLSSTPGAVPAARAPAPAVLPPAMSASAPMPASAPVPASAPSSLAAPLSALPPVAPARLKPARHVIVDAVGPAQADTGELPEAQAQLRRASPRYAQCVESNGGLDAATGQVTLRFLVRERGRAEGVGVKDRRGMSLAAAKCIAEVVDRRFVGYPAAPIVGATLTIELSADGPIRF